MLQALCIHARLGAAVGMGDGDSEGKHDRKHQSDIGLLIEAITKSGVLVAYFLFHVSATTAFASTSFAKTIKGSHHCCLLFSAWMHVESRAAQ